MSTFTDQWRKSKANDRHTWHYLAFKRLELHHPLFNLLAGNVESALTQLQKSHLSILALLLLKARVFLLANTCDGRQQVSESSIDYASTNQFKVAASRTRCGCLVQDIVLLGYEFKSSTGHSSASRTDSNLSCVLCIMLGDRLESASRMPIY